MDKVICIFIVVLVYLATFTVYSRTVDNYTMGDSCRSKGKVYLLVSLEPLIEYCFEGKN